MTLMRGRFISYEDNRMVILFSMIDGKREKQLRGLDHRNG